MNTMTFYRHGDLLLYPVKKVQGKKQDSKILAYGESTGHTHTLYGNVQVYQDGEQKYIDAKEQVELRHQEHNTIPVEEGKYKVINEVEYNIFKDEIQRVKD